MHEHVKTIEVVLDKTHSIEITHEKHDSFLDYQGVPDGMSRHNSSYKYHSYEEWPTVNEKGLSAVRRLFY